MSKNQERLKEIEGRKAQLAKEIEGAEETRLAEIKTEAEKLKDEEAEVRAAIAAETSNTTPVDGKEKRKMSKIEERAKAFAENGKTEMRAVLGTGRIAKPTKASGVEDMADIAADIVDDVNAIALTGVGAWVVGYKKTNAAAADVTDGSAVAGTAATYDYVTINPGEWGILDQVSNQVKKMTDVDYLGAVERAALSALRAKASEKIVAAVMASDLTEKKKNIALDADFIKTLVLGFRAEKTKGAVKLYISQADLLALGKVRGTNEKNAVYDITFDPGSTTSGIIKEGGLAVAFRVLDGLTAGEQLFGQPGAIDMPMWDGYEISTDEGGKFFENNQIGVRGLQTAGADLVVYHGMQHIKQSST